MTIIAKGSVKKSVTMVFFSRLLRGRFDLGLSFSEAISPHRVHAPADISDSYRPYPSLAAIGGFYNEDLTSLVENPITAAA